MISIIMSTYNEKEAWLRQSIESMLNQTYRQLELILVLDNPANDLLRQVILEYQGQDARLVFVPNEENLGLVASLNKALEYVHGSYVARMDADDVAYPDRLEKQLRVMRETGADFVMSAIDFIHEDGKVVTGISDEAFGADAVAEVMKYGNIAHHPTWLMKKEVYDTLKGYRNIAYCEDMEFVLRALQEGFRIVKSPDHAVQYRLRESGISKSFTMEQAMKARYIRDKYAKGEKISQIPEEQLNSRFSGYQEKQKQSFNRADRMLDSFCQAMAEGRWLRCLSRALGGFLSNGYFRMLFMEYFKSWRVRKRLAGRGI